MTSIRHVVIADDEPLARDRIVRMLSARTTYRVAEVCEDGAAALAAIMRHRPDVVLLDIQMPELDGLAVAEAIQEPAEEWTPALIFLTAHEQYARGAIDCGALDYLLKPVTDEKLDRALARAERWLGAPAPTMQAELLGALRALRGATSWPSRIAVRDAKGIYFLNVSDVQWAEADGNYVRLHAGGRSHLLRDSVTAFMTRLDPSRFARIHRSLIVNIEGIVRLEPHAHGEYQVTMRDGARLTSSRPYNARMRALLR